MLFFLICSALGTIIVHKFYISNKTAMDLSLVKEQKIVDLLKDKKSCIINIGFPIKTTINNGENEIVGVNDDFLEYFKVGDIIKTPIHFHWKDLNKEQPVVIFRPMENKFIHLKISPVIYSICY